MQLHYGPDTSTIDTTPRIKTRHEERPRILKVHLERKAGRGRSIDKIMRRERIHARMLKGAA